MLIFNRNDGFSTIPHRQNSLMSGDIILTVVKCNIILAGVALSNDVRFQKPTMLRFVRTSVLVAFALVSLVLTGPYAEARLPGVPQPGSEWISLFDGRTLDGWMQHTGEANFSVKNGSLVGTAVANSPNSYLCTKQLYEDFLLEFDVKMDRGFNSGVQIRSASVNGHVYGPQVDILKEGRPSGYIYGVYEKGTERRGWLSNNRSVTEAFKSDQWNHYRIRAVGPRIQTRVNGQSVADLTDRNITQTGIIGIQVHQVSEKHAGKQVQFKNIRLKPLNIERWTSLFNGSDLNNWRNTYDHGKLEMRNGTLLLHSVDKKYFVTSRNTYDDFIFEASVKMPSRSANSGIMFRSPLKDGKVYGYQAEIDSSDRQWSGGLYEKGGRGWIAPLKNEPHRQSAFEPVGWNRFRIHAEGNRIRIYVNGIKTADVTDDKYDSGHIALQHHGEKGKPYKFRDIRILELND